MRNRKWMIMVMAVCCVLALVACTSAVDSNVKNKTESEQESDGNVSVKASYENAEQIDLSEYTDLVTIDKEGTYVLSGELQGQVLVEAKDKEVTLILDNVDITSESSAAIYVKKAANVTITLADGSNNTLTDGTEYVYDDQEKEEPNSTLFSKSDLTIDGNGTLTINANFNNGIKTKDILTVLSGNINITAVNDGLSGNDGINISGGNITLDVGDDGIHSEADLVISGGNITVINSYEGLEGENVYINGGNIDVTSSDDGINAAGGSDDSTAGIGRESFGEGSDTHVYINGGTVLVHADGDGIDSNGSIFMTGGTVTVYGPTDNADGAIDYETGMTVSGGTLIAVGSSGMACAPTSTENQSFIMVNVNGSEGQEVIVTDSDNTEMIRFTAQKKFSNLVLSTADIVEGETYYISVDNNEKTECTAGESQGGFGHGGNMGGEFQHGDFKNGDFKNGDFQPGEVPGGDFQPGDKQDGNFQPGEMPGGDFQPGDKQDGDFQFGEVPDGDTQSGDFQPGQMDPRSGGKQ